MGDRHSNRFRNIRTADSLGRIVMMKCNEIPSQFLNEKQKKKRKNIFVIHAMERKEGSKEGNKSN